MSHPSENSREWQDARRRAEIYLHALRGEVGAEEEQLVASALASARSQARLHHDAHPVALVMEALIGFLPAATERPAMTPPIQRTSMLPEPMEFPVHDWIARLFGRLVAAD